MLDVCLLGSGGMMPLPYRWLTALMTRYNGSQLLIDCGEGTQIALKEKGWSFKPHLPFTLSLIITRVIRSVNTILLRYETTTDNTDFLQGGTLFCASCLLVCDISFSVHSYYGLLVSR